MIGYRRIKHITVPAFLIFAETHMQAVFLVKAVEIDLRINPQV